MPLRPRNAIPLLTTALFGQAKAIVQKNARPLRAMTTELDPPDLAELGLPAALDRLSAPLREHGIKVKLHVPPTAISIGIGIGRRCSIGSQEEF
jgi:signal transduction histidine kinase